MREGTFRPCENIVEPILDHEIFASEILPSTLTSTQETVMDVRLYAHELALYALAKVRGGAELGLPADPPDSREITAARGMMQAYLPELRAKLTRAHYLYSSKKMLETEGSEDPLQSRVDFQYEMVQDVWRHLQMVRLRPHQTIGSDVLSALENGVIIVAPTGSGKTFITAKVLQLCGIGRVLEGTQKPQSALVSVPSLELIDQYASGDKRNIFRQIIGWDVPIAEYHGRSKEQAAVTLITHRSLQTATEGNAIKGKDYDYTAFDEVHHATACKTFPAIRRLRGTMIGTTATPAYNPTRDVRRYFPHLDGGSALDFIELGILNPTRLFSFAATSSEHGTDIGATLAADWISQGLRTLIYCEYGQEQLQARRLATHINAVLGQNAVRAVGSYQGNTSDQDIDSFRNGGLMGLTATGKLKEGFDDNVDAVILLGCRSSILEVSQIVGRAMRLGDKISRIAEVIPPNVSRLNVRSIWEAFGLETIRQGQLIGSPRAYKPTQTGTPVPQITADGGYEIAPSDVPEKLQQHLVPSQLVRTAFLAPNVIKESEAAPEGYVLAEAVAIAFNTTIAHAHSVLSKAGIGVHKSWIQIGRERAHEWWFAPEAQAYFKENPPLQVAHVDAMRVSQLIELTGLSRQFFTNVAQRLLLTPQERLIIGSSKPAHFYSPADVAKILNEVDDLPFADPSDVPVGELSHSMSEGFVRKYVGSEIQAVTKRRHPQRGLKGICEHVTIEEAEKLWAKYKTLSDGRMNLSEIAEQADVSLPTISKNLTPAERQLLRSRYGAGRGSQKTLPLDAAALVIERHKSPQAPPSHLAPSIHLYTRFGSVPKTTYKRWLRQFDPDFEYIKISTIDVVPLCVKWDAYRKLEGRFAIAPHSPIINYSRLPHEPGDFLDDPRTLYARTILDFYGLPLPSDDVPLPAVMEALHITPFAAQFLANPKYPYVRNYESGEDHVSPEAIRELFKDTAKIAAPPIHYMAAHEAVTKFAGYFTRRSIARQAIGEAIANPSIPKTFVRPAVTSVGDVYMEYNGLRAVIRQLLTQPEI